MATDAVKNTVRGYRQQGMTYQAIADKMDMSVGFVHKTYKGAASDDE
jgi:DNA-directed RNA polymerase specialized sigma24 family protein